MELRAPRGAPAEPARSSYDPEGTAALTSLGTVAAHTLRHTVHPRY